MSSRLRSQAGSALGSGRAAGSADGCARRRREIDEPHLLLDHAPRRHEVRRPHHERHEERLVVEIEAVGGPEVLAEPLAVVRGDDHDGARVERAQEVGQQVVRVADLALVGGERPLVLVAPVAVGEERRVGARRGVGLVHHRGAHQRALGGRAVERRGRRPAAAVRAHAARAERVERDQDDARPRGRGGRHERGAAHHREALVEGDAGDAGERLGREDEADAAPGERREVERGVEPAPVARVGGRVEAPLEERRVAGGEREAHRREARGPPRLLDPVAEDQARAGRDVDLGRLALLSGRGGEGTRADGQEATLPAQRLGERDHGLGPRAVVAAHHERRRARGHHARGVELAEGRCGRRDRQLAHQDGGVDPHVAAGERRRQLGGHAQLVRVRQRDVLPRAQHDGRVGGEHVAALACDLGPRERRGGARSGRGDEAHETGCALAAAGAGEEAEQREREEGAWCARGPDSKMQRPVTIPARHPRRNALVLAGAWVAVVLVFWLGLFVPAMRPGIFRPEAVDLYGYFFPKFVYGSAELERGALPLWNPYEYAGVPFLGAAQPAVLYPPRVLLFALLPPTAALHVFMVVHYLLLGAGAFVMLRALALEVPGACLGTLLVAFEPLMMGGHYHPPRIACFAWVPWMVAAFVRTVEGRGLGAALGLAVAAALQATAGYPEYSLDTPPALRALPPFSLFRSFLCWGSIVVLPLAALAGAGFDRLMPGRRGAREAVAGTVALAALLPLLPARSLAWLALALAVLVGSQRAPRAAIVGLLALTLADVWTFVPAPLPATLRHRYAEGQVPYPSLDAELRRADALRAACGAGSGGRVLAPPETLAGLPVAGRLRAVQGYPESLPPARMSRLLEAAGLAPATLLALDWERLARAHGLLGLLDVSCLVVEPGHERQLADLGLAAGGQLADGRTAYVRQPEGTAFVVGEPRFAESEDAALAAVLDPEFAPRRTVVLEGTDAPFAPAACADGGCAPGEVETVAAGPGRVRFRVTAQTASHLVVSANHAPGWRARVDGRPAPVLRADYALMAVPVAPGAHEVELWYRPGGFAPAVVLSLLGVALTAVGGLRCLGRSSWWRSSPPPPSPSAPATS